MTKAKLVLVLSLSLAVLLSCAFAKEGSDNYPHGAENWMAGAVPGPGFYYLDYFMYYSGELRDGAGNKVNLGGTTPSVSAVAEAARFLYVPNFHMLGGTYAVHLIVPVVYQNVDLGGKKSATTLGDLSLIPFALSYHSKVVHQYVSLEFDAPTGHFNAADPRVSVGSGSWTVMPIYGISLLPHSGWDVSGKFMYDFHLKNPIDNYKSGQEFHFDYLTGKHIGHFGLAAAGYFVKQTTDDTLSGVIVSAAPGIYGAGRRGQVFSIGPSVIYTAKNHMMFIAQYMHETIAENRFSGDKVLLKVIIPVSALATKK
jgi:hypothetical protein